MIDINLLPGGLAKKSSFIRFIKILRTVDVVGSIVFGALLFVVAGVLAVNTGSLNNSTQTVEELKVRAKRLQASEQQYYLVKGRVDSIKDIFKEENTLKDISNFSTLYSSLVGSGSITSLDVAPLKTDIAVNFESSQKMKEFFSKIADINYSRIVVDSLSFNPNTGYQALFKFYP